MISLEHYRALREAAGLVDRRGRGRLSLTGDDRRSYLHGLLTNDIAALGPGQGCYAALLTPQGRMIADMRVLELGDAVLMDLDRTAAATVLERLQTFVFSEDVAVVDVTETLAQLGVYGPSAPSAIASAIGGNADALKALLLYGSTSRVYDGGSITVVRSDDYGIPGFDLFVDSSRFDALASSLRHGGAVDVEPAVVEVVRVESGRPLFGADMDEQTIPLEAGIENRAISLTKGCYVGQEIIIRVLHRGHGRVARKLVGITMEAAAPQPARGDHIRSGDRDIGTVTSAVTSPTLGKPIALGYVHRDFTKPGTPVSVAYDQSALPAVVTRTPFV
jgi:folate-binding protein YgfZ